MNCGLNFDKLIDLVRENDCVAYVTPRDADGRPIVAVVIAGPSMIEQVEQLVRPLTAEGEDGPPASVYLAGPDLLDACKFSLSVHEAQGLYDLSGRLAADKLRAAIALAAPEAATTTDLRPTEEAAAC